MWGFCGFNIIKDGFYGFSSDAGCSVEVAGEDLPDYGFGIDADWCPAGGAVVRGVLAMPAEQLVRGFGSGVACGRDDLCEAEEAFLGSWFPVAHTLNPILIAKYAVENGRFLPCWCAVYVFLVWWRGGWAMDYSSSGTHFRSSSECGIPHKEAQ